MLSTALVFLFILFHILPTLPREHGWSTIRKNTHVNVQLSSTYIRQNIEDIRHEPISHSISQMSRRELHEKKNSAYNRNKMHTFREETDTQK